MIKEKCKPPYIFLCGWYNTGHSKVHSWTLFVNLRERSRTFMFMFMFTQVRPSSPKFIQVRPSSLKFAYVRPSSLKFRDERSFNYFLFFELIEISGKNCYLIKVTVLFRGREHPNLPSEVQGLLRKSPVIFGLARTNTPRFSGGRLYYDFNVTLKKLN